MIWVQFYSSSIFWSVRTWRRRCVFFFCHHVRTVTLVTMQHICDDIKKIILTTSKVLVLVGKCEPTLIASFHLSFTPFYFWFLGSARLISSLFNNTVIILSKSSIDVRTKTNLRFPKQHMCGQFVLWISCLINFTQILFGTPRISVFTCPSKILDPSLVQ